MFLENPYYSITRFKKFKITNSNSKTATNKQYQRNAIAAYRADNQVCCMVDYFNDHLRLINRNYGTPRISQIKVITKLPNSEQSYKGKVQTHNYLNRQNQSTTGKL